MESPPFSDANGTDRRVYFMYHMDSSVSQSDSLSVQYFDGTSWSTAWSHSGSEGDFWLPAKVTLPGTAQSVRFLGATGSGLAGRMAVDAVKTAALLPDYDTAVVCGSAADTDCAWRGSGFPRLTVADSCNSYVNGVYQMLGQTLSGRPYYKRVDPDSETYLYHDLHCAGSSSYWQSWIFDYGQPSLTTDSDLDGDGICDFYSYQSSEADLPPLSRTWVSWCDSWVLDFISLQWESNDDKAGGVSSAESC